MIGHKIGLTSRAMQISSQIDEPDYGTLLDSMLFTCTPGQVLEIPASRFIAPRVEVELAFVLKSELKGPDVGVEQVLAATDYVTPAQIYNVTGSRLGTWFDFSALFTVTAAIPATAELRFFHGTPSSQSR